MHYLIDGHNLIARMPDISLNDPDDEVQLILRLRSWTARSKKRQVTLFFDGGIPGGKNVKLSTPQVQVIFASAGQTADALLINGINRVKNPPEFQLVSSDQQIIAAAAARKMPHITSDKFAVELAAQWQERPPGPTIADDDPIISDAEVADWLAAFGPVDERAIRNRPKPAPPNLPPPAPEPVTTPDTPPPPLNREEPQLSNKELEEWLTLFGGEPKKKKPVQGVRSPTTPAAPPATSPKKPRRPQPSANNPHNLSPEDLAAWQDFASREE
ncbi:MAG TPA: NYN domain-containing protein [Chloroflexota bacterium]|nr:NYN domain-containing protein [Chloroflexota bacterium]